jgi:hypothetical protein
MSNRHVPARKITVREIRFMRQRKGERLFFGSAGFETEESV